MTLVTDFEAAIGIGNANLSRLNSAVNDAPGTFTTSEGVVVENLRKRLLEVGFKVPVVYVSGLTALDGSFTVVENGRIYAANPAITPFTTSGPFDPAQWVYVTSDPFPTLDDMLASSDASRGEGSKWMTSHFVYVEANAAATDNDLETAGGVKLYLDVVGLHAIPAEALGFTASASTADRTTALQKAINKTQVSGVTRIFLPPTGEMTAWEVNQIELPTFSVDDPLQIPARSLEIYGMSEINTWLKLPDFDTTSDYLIGHATTGQIVDRAQNSFVRMHHMRLTRKPEVGVNKPVIAIDNTWAAHLHDMLVTGNHEGGNIHVWSFSRGGAQTCTFERIRDLKERLWDTTFTTQYRLTKLRETASRYLIHFEGPIDNVGKTNNHKVVDCEVYNVWGGLVDTKPHETTTDADRFTSKTFPKGGGNDWIRLDGNFVGGEGFAKVETGNSFDAVNSQASFDLPLAGANRNLGDYNDFILRVYNSQTEYWHSRRILSFDGQTVVIDTPFPFTVTTSSQWEIAYSSQSFWAEGGHPGVRIHTARHSTLVFRFHMSNNRMEEGVRVVKMSYASPTNISLFDNDAWSTRQEDCLIFDSVGERVQYFLPGLAIGQQPHGPYACNASMILNGGLILSREDVSSEISYIAIERTNASGVNLPAESWYRIGVNDNDVLLPMDYTDPAWTPHAYFYNEQLRHAEDGQAMSMVMRGSGPVKVFIAAGQTISIGDEIVSDTRGNTLNVGAKVVTAGTVPYADRYRVLGRIRSSFDNTGGPDQVASVRATIGLMTC